ncbi:helix-turn-helix domain-containing protein [Kocuria massiliensis]|uniref:helix-turn-helix domain-containing protein n=1 Tax=Kocuria massiliensis TaxID=1926282 RepID=UPI0022B9C165|nr:helix-turn-helix transcriptional regulator [Kocuria massiliensis]
MRNKEDVGESVRLLRKALGMTVRDLSEMAGVSISYVSQVESNQKQPSASWINNLMVSIAQHQRKELEAGKQRA